MCGLLGVYGNVERQKIIAALRSTAVRGKDSYGYWSLQVPKAKTFSTLESMQTSLQKEPPSPLVFFHSLHAIVGFVPQPLIDPATGSALIANLELYNWKELAIKYNVNVKNDAELLLKLLLTQGIKILDELDGDYAFSFFSKDRIILARDLMGVKPLCYAQTTEGFAFASERKALAALGLPSSQLNELDPCTVLTYILKTKKVTVKRRRFYSLDKKQMKNYEKTAEDSLLQELEAKLTAAVAKRTDGVDHLGILFSGGIDSTVLAMICKKLGKKPILYTAGIDYGGRPIPDLVAAEEVARFLKLPLKKNVISLAEAPAVLKNVMRIIETDDVMKVGVATPFALAATLAQRDKLKVILSGLGSEELFAGYERHQVALQQEQDVNAVCIAGLREMWQRDLYRDDLIMMAHQLELRVPFLDHALIMFSKDLPVRYKITDIQKKIILRKVALTLGLPIVFAERKKLGAQYGSNVDKALEKLAKSDGMAYKHEYLEKLGKSS